jgi:hypothetical protein
MKARKILGKVKRLQKIEVILLIVVVLFFFICLEFIAWMQKKEIDVQDFHSECSGVSPELQSYNETNYILSDRLIGWNFWSFAVEGNEHNANRLKRFNDTIFVCQVNNSYNPKSLNAEKESAVARSVTTQPEIFSLTLIPVGDIHAYPGPDHFEGDILSFEIILDRGFYEDTSMVNMKLDNLTEISVPARLLTYDRLFIPLALNTANMVGNHQLKFSILNGSLNHIYSFEVLPATMRQLTERDSIWMTYQSGCCVLHYLSNTAAMRDIESIAKTIDDSAKKIEIISNKKIDQRLRIYLIDRIWGNGGFAVDKDIGITYTDRNAGPLRNRIGLETVAVHELSHSMNIGNEMQKNTSLNFSSEGVAVFVSGGHYKPEPIEKRVAALYHLGYYVPVGEDIGQHELGYLHSAAVLTYISQRYGQDAVWKFLSSKNCSGNMDNSLNCGLQQNFGISLVEFNQDFEKWTKNIDPGDQVDDLRLTIELQDMRRHYQNEYAPPPEFISYDLPDIQSHQGYISVLTRKFNAPVNVAIELLIAAGQQAIIDKRYKEAEGIILLLNQTLSQGTIEDINVKNYLDIVIKLNERGYNAVYLDIQKDNAKALVSNGSLEIINLTLLKSEDIWDIVS